MAGPIFRDPLRFQFRDFLHKELTTDRAKKQIRRALYNVRDRRFLMKAMELVYGRPEATDGPSNLNLNLTVIQAALALPPEALRIYAEGGRLEHGDWTKTPALTVGEVLAGAADDDQVAAPAEESAA